MFGGQDPLPSQWPYDHAYIINPETRTRCNHRPKTVATSNRSILKMWCQGWVPQNLEGTRMYAPEMIVMVSKTYLIHVNSPQYPVHCKVCMQAAISWWGGSHPCSLLRFEVTIVPLIVFVWPFVMAHNNHNNVLYHFRYHLHWFAALVCIHSNPLYTLVPAHIQWFQCIDPSSCHWIVSRTCAFHDLRGWTNRWDLLLNPLRICSHTSAVYFLGEAVYPCVSDVSQSQQVFYDSTISVLFPWHVSPPSERLVAKLGISADHSSC